VRVKWILTSLFIFILSGCSEQMSDTESIDEADFTAYEKNLTRLDNISLSPYFAEKDLTSQDEMSVSMDNDEVEHGLKSTLIQFYPEQDIGREEIEELQDFITEIGQAHEKVIGLWENQFEPLYQNRHVYIENGVSEANLNEVDQDIENLRHSYETLSTEVKDLEVPSSLPKTIEVDLQDTQNEIRLAIDNRILALIEFESMDTGQDVSLHDEFLAIHIENSDMYLERAATHLMNLTFGDSE
jgi:hypothetical protein